MSYGVALIFVGLAWLVSLAIFTAYIILDKQYFNTVEQTIRESPSVTAALSKLKDWQLETPPTDEEPELVGLIVEPRSHHNLIPVIENFQTVLPGVPVYVCHGNENLPILKERFGNSLIYMNIGVDNLTINQYNFFMTRPELYDAIHGKRILVFQTDSVLFTASKVKVQEFFKYDYVGAPWREMVSLYLRNMAMFRSPNTKDTHSGNGGLSLRNRETMIRATREHPYFSIGYSEEDVYFSYALDKLGAKMPDKSEAARFSFERVEASELPFGAHKYLPSSFRSQIQESEAKIVESYGVKPLDVLVDNVPKNESSV